MGLVVVVMGGEEGILTRGLCRGQGRHRREATYRHSREQQQQAVGGVMAVAVVVVVMVLGGVGIGMVVMIETGIGIVIAREAGDAVGACRLALRGGVRGKQAAVARSGGDITTTQGRGRQRLPSGGGLIDDVCREMKVRLELRRDGKL